MHELPGDLSAGPILDEFLRMLCRVRDISTQQTGMPASSPFPTFTQNAIFLFRCLGEAGQKPTVAEVREAHKRFSALAQEQLPESCFAKALSTYASGKSAMESALVYSHMGVEDEAAGVLFFSQVDQLESPLEPAFNDLILRADFGNEGRPHNLTSAAPLIASTTTLVTSLGNSRVLVGGRGVR